MYQREATTHHERRALIAHGSRMRKVYPCPARPKHLLQLRWRGKNPGERVGWIAELGRNRDEKRLEEVSMRLAWIETSPSPFLVTAVVLVIGILLMLIDLWQVRNYGLSMATPSKARNQIMVLGLVWTQLVSGGISFFLSTNPLTPQSLH